MLSLSSSLFLRKIKTCNVDGAVKSRSAQDTRQTEGLIKRMNKTVLNTACVHMVECLYSFQDAFSLS